jgi:hypothetical protein
MSEQLKPIVKNLTPKILFELFKIQIPMSIIFVDSEGNENLDYRIKIESRVYDKGENKPFVRIGSGKSLFKDSYLEKLLVVRNQLRTANPATSYSSTGIRPGCSAVSPPISAHSD